MSEDGGQEQCFVGKAPCGCYLYAEVLKYADAEGFKEMARMAREGWTIEVKTVQFVRDGGLNFHCEHRKKKRS